MHPSLDHDIWQNSGEFYHSLVEYNPDAIIYFDLQSRILHANPAFQKLLGFSIEEIRKIPAISLIIPEHHDKRNFHFKEAVNGIPQEFEETLLHKNGHRIQVRSKYVPIYIDKEIVGIHAIAKDITERKKIEKQLREATERYESFFRHTTDAIGITDLNRTVLRINPAFEKMFGFTREEVIGKPAPVVPTELIKELNQFRESVSGGRPITGVETKRMRKDGTLIDVSITYSPIHDDCGNVVAYSAVYRDISDRKKMEEALVEAEAKYRTIVEKSLVGVYIVQNHKYVYVNPRLAEILGYTVEELMNMCPTDHCVPEDRNLVTTNILRRLSGETETCRYELRCLKKDQSLVWVEVHGSLIVYQGEPALIGTFVDMTDTKRTEELLRKSDKLNMVGELAAGVAHELRNPLASIRGFIQLLQHGSDISNYADVILSEIDRINTIASEFLMLAKPQVFQYQVKDIRTILTSVLSLIDTQASLNNVKIASQLGEESLLVLCEENHLKQVFINVLKNSIDASPNGGKTFIELSRSSEMVNYVRIRIIDHGCGIPQDRLVKLGEPFYTTKEKGTGLGLMISYKIIEDHKGKIIINSKENMGTTVDIYLPEFANK